MDRRNLPFLTNASEHDELRACRVDLATSVVPSRCASGRRPRHVTAHEASLRDSARPVSLEYRMRRADGVYLPVVSCRVTQHDATGRPVRIVGFLLDLSREHAATRQSHVLLETLELVTSATGVGLFRQDLTGQGGDYWNAEAYHLWGFDDRTEPPHYKEVQTHVHPDDVPKRGNDE